ncbi:MAG: helix-turn-helix domain-containing protein [Verrucomicrobiota bacterium]|nr:helix-turn-helix domain-containing protein [Verrucomicrobiota bacterium]
MKAQNVVGPQIRRIRYNLGWSQEKLVQQLEAVGLEVRRDFIAKIEGGRHRADDMYLPFFAASLKVPVADLFPKFTALASQIAELRPARKPPRSIVPPVAQPNEDNDGSG